MLKDIRVNDGVTGIGSNAFQGSGITNLSAALPSSVGTIGNSAFKDCLGLEDLPITAGVTSIETSTFAGCANAKTATIPDTVTTIGQNAFENCSGLLSVTMSDSIEKINSYAFSGCTGLVSILMNGDAIPEDTSHVAKNAFASVPSSMVIYVLPEATGWGETWMGFRVRVIGAFTKTTPTPVPYAWFDTDYPAILAAHGGDYEATANATVANGVDKIWECYVTGVNPTNATERFQATIKIGADGNPAVSWKPDLGNERTYTVEGKTNLTDDWAPATSASRFFRVKVELPESR